MVALAVPPVAWFATRPGVPVAFIGNRPPADFVFKDEFVGKPIIDFTLPGGKPISYPRKRKFVYGYEDPTALCGYLEFREAVELFSLTAFRLGDSSVSAPPSYTADPFKVVTTPSTVVSRGRGVVISRTLPSGKPYFGIPYAIDEKHRDVTLEVAGKKYALRLPVSNAFGPSIRKTTKIACGPYTVTLKPKPWLLSTAPVEFDVSTDAPPGVRLYTELKWKMPIASGGFAIWGTGAMMLLESGFKPRIQVPRMQFTGHLVGTVYELVPEKVRLRVKRNPKKGRIELSLANGRTIYGGGNHQIEHFGYKILEVGGKHITTAPYLQHSRASGYTFDKLKDGQWVEGTGYRVKDRWAADVKLDVPPPLKRPNESTMYIYGSSGIGSNHYSIHYGP